MSVDDGNERGPNDMGVEPLSGGTAAMKAMDCNRLVSLLGEYVDDALPAADKSAVDGHMNQCAPCVAFLRQYRFAQEAARRVLLEKVPVDLETRLLSFLKSRCQKK